MHSSYSFSCCTDYSTVNTLIQTKEPKQKLSSRLTRHSQFPVWCRHLSWSAIQTQIKHLPSDMNDVYSDSFFSMSFFVSFFPLSHLFYLPNWWTSAFIIVFYSSEIFRWVLRKWKNESHWLSYQHNRRLFSIDNLRLMNIPMTNELQGIPGSRRMFSLSCATILALEWNHPGESHFIELCCCVLKCWMKRSIKNAEYLWRYIIVQYMCIKHLHIASSE